MRGSTVHVDIHKIVYTYVHVQTNKSCVFQTVTM